MEGSRNSTHDLSDEKKLYKSEMKFRVYLAKSLKDRMSRRELLKAGGLTSLTLPALWALACQPAAPAPTPTKAPVAVAPTPTTAPVAVAPTPTKPPVPTPTPEAKIGRHLIGKPEGPEVITDVAKYPKAFKEAPPLAELAKAGKLPAVKERIGEDPLVIKPVHEIGKYGGTWRRGFTGPADYVNLLRAASGPDYPLYVDWTGNTLVPNIVKGWEVTDGAKTTTIFLRRGMKWSNGQPFTADDFVFWWEDMYQNKDLVPSPSAYLAIGGKPGTMEKVDTYTVRFKFPSPYYLFSEFLGWPLRVMGQAFAGRLAMGLYAPAHYLKQFHPKYVAKADLDKKVADAKFDNWVSLLKFKNTWDLNPELPVLAPWKTLTPSNTPVCTLERNPYSIWVDTEGNQLPYIDKVVYTLAENLEVLNLRAIAGEYDKQSTHIELRKLPVFLANQEKGGYKVSLNPMLNGSDYAIWVNLHFEADPEVAKWLNNLDFRRALSLGIERDQINEAFFLGLGVPGSVVPADINKLNPGPEYRTMWHTYDPKKANEMLDKMGLDKKDGAGYRLRTDGKGRLRIEIQTWGGQTMAYTEIAEMLREQWKKIGIAVFIQEVERSLGIKRAGANETNLFLWPNDGSEMLTGMGNAVFPVEPLDFKQPLYGVWFASGGEKGKEPPPGIRAAMEKFRQAFGVPEGERIKLGKEIWKLVVEEMWTIGIVGQAGGAAGVRVAKTNLGNVPTGFIHLNDTQPPNITRPVTYYWKS